MGRREALHDALAPDRSLLDGRDRIAHAESDASQRRKLAQAAIESTVPVEPIVHGYGPLDYFIRRFRVAAGVRPQRVWVNRYGYLSDAKLDAIGRIAAEARHALGERA